MDRRRFVPSSEALDSRLLLSSSSLFGQSSALTASGAQATQSPDTYLQKLKRVEHIPTYLDSLQPGRFLPADAVHSLQSDTAALAATLHFAPSPVLNAFNLEIRSLEPRRSLSPQEVGRLNTLFGTAIEEAGATPELTTSLQNDLNAIARADANSPNSVYLATNDYSILLQGILIVGRPIQTPDKPLLALHNGIRSKTAGNGWTNKPEPTFVGYYRVGATIDPGTQVQILDVTGNILGQASVVRSGEYQGRYQLTLDKPLSVGLHYLRIRAADAEGHLSEPSSLFAIRVVTPPGGPHALKT